MSEIDSVLNDFAAEYQELVGRIRIEQYEVPLNLESESARVDAAYRTGERVDPHFEFAKVDLSSIPTIHDLARRARNVGNPWLDSMVVTLDYLAQSLADHRLHLAPDTTRRTSAMYGGLTSGLMAAARKVLAEPVARSTEVQSVDAEQAAQVISEALYRVNLGDWRSTVHPRMNAMMDVSGERREIRIRQGTRFTKTAISRLLVHEIGCHVFRSASGSRQSIKLLGFGLGDYLATEEGLACYQEEQSGLEDQEDSRRLALRYLAAGLSIDQSLFDVYSQLRQHSGHDQAFETAARAKRGIADTSQPGAHLKDKLYFEGMKLVSHHLRTTPADEEILYMGKVSLRMVPMLKAGLADGSLMPAAFGPSLISQLRPNIELS